MTKESVYCIQYRCDFVWNSFDLLVESAGRRVSCTGLSAC
jgi:hypothetical protein